GCAEGAGLFRAIMAGKSQLKVQPEITRMLDQGAAIQPAGIPAGLVETTPQDRQPLWRLLFTMHLGGQGLQFGLITPHLYLAETVAPWIGISGASNFQQSGPHLLVVHREGPEIQAG